MNDSQTRGKFSANSQPNHYWVSFGRPLPDLRPIDTIKSYLFQGFSDETILSKIGPNCLFNIQQILVF